MWLSPIVLLLMLGESHAVETVSPPPLSEESEIYYPPPNWNSEYLGVVDTIFEPPPHTVAVDVRFDVVMPKASAKLVWCKSFLLEATDGIDPTNIVAVEPVTGNQSIHHMHLHACDADAPKWLEHQNMYKYDEGYTPRLCHIHNGGASRWSGCRTVTWSFLPGERAMTFPEGVGMKIGEGQWDLRHVLLEVQFDDTYETDGLKSQPGFRFWATKHNVVKHHVGMLMIDFLNLPPLPKSPRLKLDLYCPSECTRKFDGDMHVFATMGYTQIEGMTVKSRIVRGNSTDSKWMKLDQKGYVAEEVLAYVSNATFVNTSLPNPALTDVRFTEFVIERGDSLTTRCVYDMWTDSDDHPLGKNTRNDGICAQTFVYWPRQDTFSCGYLDPDEMTCAADAARRRS
jgi:hypothetical protein